MNPINENSTAILTLSFKDENGNGVIPTSALYRIDDVASGTSIVAETELSPTTTTHDITITDEQNAIINSEFNSEVHEVTVDFTYSTDKKGTDSVLITIENLTFIT